MTKHIKKTNKKEEKIYAIFKKGKHMGNQKGNSKLDAVKSYLSAANYINYSNAYEFIEQYSAKIAIPGIHYYSLKKNK